MAKYNAYDFPEHFRDFAFMPKFNENIDNLAELAEPEDWDYKSTQANNPKPILQHIRTGVSQRRRR